MKALTFVILMLMTAASAAECPADRPIKRTVADYTKPVTCTLLVCAGKLVCPKGGDSLSGAACYYSIGSDCNKCTGGGVVEACFTQEEIDKAEARVK
jgi:hypothetical protein